MFRFFRVPQKSVFAYLLASCECISSCTMLDVQLLSATRFKIVGIFRQLMTSGQKPCLWACCNHLHLSCLCDSDLPKGKATEDWRRASGKSEERESRESREGTWDLATFLCFPGWSKLVRCLASPADLTLSFLPRQRSRWKRRRNLVLAKPVTLKSTMWYW